MASARSLASPIARQDIRAGTAGTHGASVALPTATPSSGRDDREVPFRALEEREEGEQARAAPFHGELVREDELAQPQLPGREPQEERPREADGRDRRGVGL